MTPEPTTAPDLEGPGAEPPPPACVMCFNASDPSGAGGLADGVWFSGPGRALAR